MPHAMVLHHRWRGLLRAWLTGAWLVFGMGLVMAQTVSPLPSLPPALETDARAQPGTPSVSAS